jgi:hypothetical protein
VAAEKAASSGHQVDQATSVRHRGDSCSPIVLLQSYSPLTVYREDSDSLLRQLSPSLSSNPL